MSTTGRAPALAMPAAKATAWLSQMPTSKNWLGKRVADLLQLVALAHGGRDHGDLGIAAAGLEQRVADGVGVGPAR